MAGFVDRYVARIYRLQLRWIIRISRFKKHELDYKLCCHLLPDRRNFPPINVWTGIEMHTVESCPFEVGDMVIYRPSARGLATDIMSSSSSQLIPGTAYRIVEVQKNVYVIVEGYHHPGGGIYWTEFKALVT